MAQPDSPDSLCDFVLDRLLSSPEGWRALVREAAARWPDVPPLALAFALTAAGAEIEATFAPGSPARDAAAHAFRLAALLAADLYAMEALGLPRATAADLTRYWQGYDRYFLTL